MGHDSCQAVVVVVTFGEICSDGEDVYVGVIYIVSVFQQLCGIVDSSHCEHLTAWVYIHIKALSAYTHIHDVKCVKYSYASECAVVNVLLPLSYDGSSLRILNGNELM